MPIDPWLRFLPIFLGQISLDQRFPAHPSADTGPERLQFQGHPPPQWTQEPGAWEHDHCCG